MRHLISPLDFTVEETQKLLDLACDIEKNRAKYAHVCDGKKEKFKKEKKRNIKKKNFLPQSN